MALLWALLYLSLPEKVTSLPKDSYCTGKRTGHRLLPSRLGPKSWHGLRGHLPSCDWAEVSCLGEKTGSLPFVYDMKQAVPWRYGQCC